MSRHSLAIALALGTVWVVWGSTYFAIREVVESLPAISSSGARFALAGLVLILLARARGTAWPGRAQWWAASRAGLLLVPLGNGLVSLAEQHVPSSLAALVMATLPAQLLLLGWARGGPRPGGRAMVGLVLGLVGVALLGGGGLIEEGSVLPLSWLLVLGLAAGSWALGSLELRAPDAAPSSGMALGLASLVGGLAALLVGLFRGELVGLALGAVPATAWLAFVYLLVMGSLVAGLAYTWLIKVAPMRLVATYAYVNPLVAVALGVLLGGEALEPRTLVAGGVMLLGVILVVNDKARPDCPAPRYPPVATESSPPRRRWV